MKNKLFSLILLSFLATIFLALPFVTIQAIETPDYTYTDQNIFNLQTILERIADWVFWIVMTLAFIFIVLAGFSFMTSDGEPEKIKKARNQLIYALIGVAVAVLAYALISWVATFFGIQTDSIIDNIIMN